MCAPGCFSLFRGSALMDDNVARTYATRATEAGHYIQYDQGTTKSLSEFIFLSAKTSYELMSVSVKQGKINLKTNKQKTKPNNVTNMHVYSEYNYSFCFHMFDLNVRRSLFEVGETNISCPVMS